MYRSSSSRAIWLGTRGRRGIIEREIAALRADDDFVACDIACGEGFPEGRADGALGSLAPIVDRGIDEVDAVAERMIDGGGIPIVLGVVTLAEVGTDADRRDQGAAGDRAVEVGREAILEASGIAQRSVGRRPAPQPRRPLRSSGHRERRYDARQ